MIEVRLLSSGGGRRLLIGLRRSLLILRLLILGSPVSGLLIGALIRGIARTILRLIHDHVRGLTMMVNVMLVVMRHPPPTNTNQNDEDDEKHLSINLQ